MKFLPHVPYTYMSMAQTDETLKFLISFFFWQTMEKKLILAQQVLYQQL